MTPELVMKALVSFSEFLMKYLVALAAVGALTMALIEAYKKVFNSLTSFHFNFIRGFIDSDQEAQRTSREINEKLQLSHAFSDTFPELVHLMSGIEVGKARLIDQLMAYRHSLSNLREAKSGVCRDGRHRLWHNVRHVMTWPNAWPSPLVSPVQDWPQYNGQQSKGAKKGVNNQPVPL
ncbi:MAG: hypothetical protein WA003_04015 [Desulfuromonadaceae bacterium]